MHPPVRRGLPRRPLDTGSLIRLYPIGLRATFGVNTTVRYTRASLLAENGGLRMGSRTRTLPEPRWLSRQREWLDSRNSFLYNDLRLGGRP